MGRPVAHCVHCGHQVLAADLESGKAFRFTGGHLCTACALERPDCLSPEQKEFLCKMDEPSIPVAADDPKPTPAFRPRRGRIPLRWAPRSGPPRGLLTACVAAGLLFIAVAGIAAGGRPAPARPTPEPPRPFLARTETPFPKSRAETPTPPEPEPELPGAVERKFAPPPPPSSPAPPLPAPGWRSLFDGRSIEFLRSSSRSVWRVAEGALQPAHAGTHAAQTREEFSDGELRIRFEHSGASLAAFAIRQGGEGKYGVSIVGRAPGAGPHEILFTCRGDQVAASLDGVPLLVEATGRPRSGCLQFNAGGGSFRILSIDIR